ncbi:MAG: IPT/TIG domain-containing protein [Candidatus Thiodiazotropha sp.]
MTNKGLIDRFYKYLTVLVPCLSMLGCGGGSSDDFTPTSNKMTYTAELYGETPPGQYLGIEAERSNVELPNIYYDPAIISNIHANVDGSVIDLFIHVVSPLSLGAGSFTTYIDVINSDDHQSVELSYIITDPTGDMLPDRRVDNIEPHTTISGSESEYVIRGSGFSYFDITDTPLISIGGYIVNEYTYINDSEIRITLPGLPVGLYNVSISNSTGDYVSAATLKAIDPFVVQATTFYLDGPKAEVIFDDSRKALYVVINNGVNRDGLLQRYKYENEGVWVSDSLTINTLTGAELASDGDTLVLAAKDGFIEIDLDVPTLEIKSITERPEYIGAIQYYLVKCNNGVVIASNIQNRSLLAYDMRKKIIYEENRSGDIRINSPFLFSKENGSQIVIREYEGNIYTMNCNGYEINQIGNVPSASSLSASPNQTLFLINGQDIYSEKFKLLSSLPETNSIGVISPDDSTIYAYDDATTTINSYDVSNVYSPIKVGEIIVEPRGNGYRATNMSISDDGNTLILATYEAVHVIDLTSASFMIE